jgi:hypothetical protein
MKALLTNSVIRFLVLEGYKYCLSRTTNVQKPNASVCITLTPIKYRPALKNLAKDYDTYFNIMREPLQLAEGVDDTEVFVMVDESDLHNYKGSISIL